MLIIFVRIMIVLLFVNGIHALLIVRLSTGLSLGHRPIGLALRTHRKTTHSRHVLNIELRLVA